MKNNMDLWANFLYNEKLDPAKLDSDSILELVYLCEKLSEKRGPKIRPYKEKLVSRRLVVDTALDLGIDLLAMKYRGKCLIGRGLLDVWLVAYKERYGSTVGTAGEWEAKRRDIKIKLAKQHGFHQRSSPCM
jgi:hypothetical protein